MDLSFADLAAVLFLIAMASLLTAAYAWRLRERIEAAAAAGIACAALVLAVAAMPR